ncbi:unnamed protein product [Toxocara canis]|uniref:Bestrophin homolog n=1 Tax=Toxocara canis TaxID=6265 RepID=A0A183UJ49_TOXCA|nr:unnamed protein product [Toxocara canis]
MCWKYSDFIPITFMLGFYVTLVVGRWWNMFKNIGWVDSFALLVCVYVKGGDEKARMIRRTIARYVCLAQVMAFRTISISVRKRFPTFDSLVDAGMYLLRFSHNSFAHFYALSMLRKQIWYLEKSEKERFEDRKYWLPIKWSMDLIQIAQIENRIPSHHAVKEMYKEILSFRNKLVSLVHFDWVPVPLVYTQTVCLTVRLYFFIAAFGRQYIESEEHPQQWPLDAFFPFLTTVQFICYVGWLKVAEALLNPFGDDDDDFECNWVIDRNLQVCHHLQKRSS